MKIHHYQIRLPPNNTIQNILHVPGEGVIGYRSFMNNIDFFSSNERRVPSVLHDTPNKYLGEIELPQQVVQDLVNLGRAYERIKTCLEVNYRCLTGLLSPTQDELDSIREPHGQ